MQIAYQDQYSPERVCDAISILDQNAEHLSNIPAQLQRLPHELAHILKADRNQRGLHAQPTMSLPSALPGHQDEAEPSVIIRRPRADGHIGALGDRENISIPESVSMFERRQLGSGCYCATRPAGRSFAQTAMGRLDNSDVWVWKVLFMYPSGSHLPANPSKLKFAETDIYEAQLYQPEHGGRSLLEPLDPVWEHLNTRHLVFSATEKADERGHAFAERQIRRHGAGGHRVLSPVTAFLRPANIIGGGFSLDDHYMVPSRIRSYIESIMARAPLQP